MEDLAARTSELREKTESTGVLFSEVRWPEEERTLWHPERY